jgi:hypothetical protein
MLQIQNKAYTNTTICSLQHKVINNEDHYAKELELKIAENMDS